MLALLERSVFTRNVLASMQGRCAFCDKPAVDAHHIMDRHLFMDGGYRMNNGAPVCSDHHWQCETTLIEVVDVWNVCGIKSGLLPEGFDPQGVYDKWGNRYRLDGTRSWGPMREDPGARRALAKGGFLGLFRPDVATDGWAVR